MSLFLSLALLAGCSRSEPEQVRHPLCDVGAPAVSALSPNTTPSVADVAALQEYVARIAAADSSLVVQTGAASAALADLEEVLTTSGANAQADPDTKPALTEAAKQLRTLSDAVTAATTDGCRE